MPTIHYLALEDLKMAVDVGYLLQCSDDDGDGTPDENVLAWARNKAEDYVRSRVAVRYDLAQWDIDLLPLTPDGVSDNIDGVVVDITLAIAVYKIAARRFEIPQSIIDAYNIAELKLERIAAGTMILAAASAPAASNQGISGNMVKDDLGELTEGGPYGDPLPWAFVK